MWRIHHWVGQHAQMIKIHRFRIQKSWLWLKSIKRHRQKLFYAIWYVSTFQRDCFFHSVFGLLNSYWVHWNFVLLSISEPKWSGRCPKINKIGSFGREFGHFWLQFELMRHENHGFTEWTNWMSRIKMMYFWTHLIDFIFTLFNTLMGWTMNLLINQRNNFSINEEWNQIIDYFIEFQIELFNSYLRMIYYELVLIFVLNFCFLQIINHICSKSSINHNCQFEPGIEIVRQFRFRL